MELHELTIRELAEKLRRKEVSSKEATLCCLERMEKSDLNAMNYRAREQALAAAEEADKKLASGDCVSPLFGVPITIKDNICTDDMPTTCSSRMLENHMSPFDATVVNKLRDCGAVILGKANMDEFAMGSSNETSYFGKVLNPHNKEYVPGGSSGGSAAAVAAGLCYGALGSDTGGSIRQPASYCGVVGLKPTYGSVSRFGCVAYASSFDQIGPLTKDVYDNALMFNAICGYDKMDSTSLNIAYPDYTRALKGDVRGLKIGVPKEFMTHPRLEENIKQRVNEAIEVFERGGAEVMEISLPHTEVALSVYYIVSCAEADSNLARFDGVKYGFRAENYRDLTDMYIKTRSQGFGEEVKRRLMLGNYMLRSDNYERYYIQALKVRALIKSDTDKAFEQCDVILGPTAPTASFKLGEKTDDPVRMHQMDIYTVYANLTGIPAISVPCGKSAIGLPIGLQLMAPRLGEERIYNAAYFFEGAR
jgi:aspartyl-tRNA(Asn)/glutamyl-tRNA(Gln) amidotransferase subunit A